jgi:glutaredoxin
MKKILSFSLTLLISSLLLFSCEKDDDDTINQKPVYNYIDSFDIVVFGSSQCHYCNDLEQIFSEENIPYTYLDTDDQGNSATMWQKLYDSGYQDNFVDLPVVEITTDSVRLLIQPNFENDIIPLITE